MTRLIGIDHGSRRIGLAVADREVGMAFERPALHRSREAQDLDAIMELARAEGAELAVIGLPLNMDGSEGPQAAAARRFGQGLASRGLRVEYLDERLTSWQARLGRGGGAREARAARRSGEVDSAAARLILQEYVDSQPDSSIQEAE